MRVPPDGVGVPGDVQLDFIFGQWAGNEICVLLPLGAPSDFGLNEFEARVVDPHEIAHL
jgi:hypothetical protein